MFFDLCNCFLVGVYICTHICFLRKLVRVHIEKSSRGTEKGPCMSKATQNAKLQVYFGSDYVMN